MPHDHPHSGVVHVIHSHPAGLRCLRSLRETHLEPAQIILTGKALHLFDDEDDDALHIHELAGLGVNVTVVAAHLRGLELDVHDLPAYIYLTVDLHTAVQHARQAGHAIHHWL